MFSGSFPRGGAAEAEDTAAGLLKAESARIRPETAGPRKKGLTGGPHSAVPPLPRVGNLPPPVRPSQSLWAAPPAAAQSRWAPFPPPAA